MEEHNCSLWLTLVYSDLMQDNNRNCFFFFSFLDTEKRLNKSELKEEQVNGTDGGILISWKPRDKSDSYIIDWCNFPILQPCDLQWKRFGPNTSSALIKSGESRMYFFSDVQTLLCHGH